MGDVDAPGWDAIEAAAGRLYPSQTPHHWGFDDRIPGETGLWGVSAYRDRGFWFFITYGLSELFEKTSDRPMVSGWGIELTMRVTSEAPEPPTWVVHLLDWLARWVYTSGRPYEPGTRVHHGGSITGGDPPSRLTSVAFARDPKLGELPTPFGRVAFLTAVGVTPAEVERMQTSSTAAVLAELAMLSPVLATDPTR